MLRNICIIVAGMILCLSACQDDIIVNSTNNNDKFVKSAHNANIDNGIMYQNRKFFIKSYDEQANTLTRSYGENMLKRSFSAYVEKTGNYYLGVHIMPVWNYIKRKCNSIQPVYINYIYPRWSFCRKLRNCNLVY